MKGRITNRLLWLLEHRRESWASAAQKLNMTRSGASQLVQSLDPKASTIVKLARAFGILPGWLFLPMPDFKDKVREQDDIEKNSGTDNRLRGMAGGQAQSGDEADESEDPGRTDDGQTGI